jgi:hypothetical protein
MTRDRDNPRFGRVVIVPMTSASPNNPPAVGFDKLDRVSDLHLNCIVSILDGHAQTEVFHKWIEVPAVIEQFVPTFDASRSD